MLKRKLFVYALFALILAYGNTVIAQNEYRYSIDLTKTTDDTLTAQLQVPNLKKSTVTFSFPRIIPGTYAISDYGRFVSSVKAFDKAGKALPVKRISDNKWRISNALTLASVSYKVDDIFDTEVKHGIYPMAATNFEHGKVYVFNTPGVFGYFDGFNQLPYTITVNKPGNLYASTSLEATDQTANRDVFKLANVDELYDSPIMYSIPDTTMVTVGNCKVLVSVYSPGKNIQSRQIAGWLTDLLESSRKYLGGKLPADKYAFLYYFREQNARHSFPAGLGGALEHNTSSFYYLPDLPANMIKASIVNTSSHEFFHIITPLTIASKQIKQFNYDSANLSKHLWLYEGITEYTAHHVQVKNGLISTLQFLNVLGQKITTSRTRHNDTLSFTEMSKYAAGKYEKEYGNVYEKGALIGACLDLLLLNLSDGNYGLQDLTHDLGVRYGRARHFEDEELFSVISELSYPEVEEFLRKYVAGSTPIPYQYYFDLAGVKYTPRLERKIFSIGGLALVPTQKATVFIHPQSRINDFGQKLGYKAYDELYALNGIRLSPSNYQKIVDSIKNSMREGDNFTAIVGRKNASGGVDTLTLSSAIFKATDVEMNKLELNPAPTARQRMLQQRWLTSVVTPMPANAAARPEDVNSIDGIMKALYGVISGPAGPRDWNRFAGLFLPEAKMGAVMQQPSAASQVRFFSPDEYRKNNSPFFMQSGFYEEEIKRKVDNFGNLANITSSYQYRLKEGGQVEKRGINYVTLVKSEGRWWISSLLWQEEDDANKLPAELAG